jgi:hypothetical protein
LPAIGHLLIGSIDVPQRRAEDKVLPPHGEQLAFHSKLL